MEFKTNKYIQTVDNKNVNEIQVMLSDEKKICYLENKTIKICDLASASCIKTIQTENYVDSIFVF